MVMRPVHADRAAVTLQRLRHPYVMMPCFGGTLVCWPRHYAAANLLTPSQTKRETHFGRCSLCPEHAW